MAEQKVDYYNLPISTTDAASMLRRKVSRNAKPYTQITTELNNKLIDEWKERVLNKLADRRNTVPSGKVWSSWQLFLEGKGCEKYVELRDKGLIRHVDKEVLEFWLSFFKDRSIEEMHAYGVGVVNHGWSLVKSEMQMWYADEKWEKLYSKSRDPMDWEKEHFKYQDLISGKQLPSTFGWDEEILTDIHEKVGTVLFNQINPDQS